MSEDEPRPLGFETEGLSQLNPHPRGGGWDDECLGCVKFALHGRTFTVGGLIINYLSDVVYMNLSHAISVD